MPATRLHQRQKLYYKLSSRIAQISDAHLHSLFAENETQSSFGATHTLDIDRSKVFVKKVPVTRLEHANMFSTRNLYNLPTYYNYPFNSAGFGAFRELVAHIKTTNWVLEGAMPYFPLMYHYRIIPFTGTRKAIPQAQLARYVEYWGGDHGIEQYILDRVDARHELVLFLENFPHGNAASWMAENPSRIQPVLDDMRTALAFLRKNGIIHFDSHFHNILTDGKHAYLSDFGLVLDKSFELSPAESRFYKEHIDYDYGNLIWALGFLLSSVYKGLSDADRQRVHDRYHVSPDIQFDDLLLVLLRNLDDLQSSGLLQLNPAYSAILARYRDIILLNHEFYVAMRANNRKDNRLDHAKLRRLLKQTEFLA